MYQIIKQFNPDEKDKLGESKSPDNIKKDADSVEKSTNSENPEGEETIIEKIKDALQDWSNDNERDIEEDDSSALRSGL